MERDGWLKGEGWMAMWRRMDGYLERDGWLSGEGWMAKRRGTVAKRRGMDG